ncbi:hypothetical protein [Cupriavidus sp. D39]|uniref:hypothetical protein n=1 Tax=Cupriavidus sp. D39 TaxID=2997877 RepID=UPI002271E665|nr:hypothetical protein [Cupriavidus sp. D39]MCY0854732.1 hypothetical protein [Cupriavidus sp. D39]
MLDKTKFAASFAGDVKADRASFLANAQVPWGVDAWTGEITSAAWRQKPSWYPVEKDDKMIPPDVQRAMSKRAGATVVESQGSHGGRGPLQPTAPSLARLEGEIGRQPRVTEGGSALDPLAYEIDE